MPVGRPCSLHGFNWALCELHRAHKGTCGYSREGTSTCTGFQPCDPTAVCTCSKCKDVAKLKDFAWKCEQIHEEWPTDKGPATLDVCGHIDSDLPLLRSSCPRCNKYDVNKVQFFSQCVKDGLITPDAWLAANKDWVDGLNQQRDEYLGEYLGVLREHQMRIARAK